MKYRIETINAAYDKDVCRVIKSVGAEFNAIGEGFGPGDAEVLNMSSHYTASKHSIYYVGIINNKVVGGCGIAAFNGNNKICELRKLFILPEARGHNLGEALTISCLDYAKSKGYQQCYLETLETMEAALALYSKLGFSTLSQPFEGSTHNACNVWMLKGL